jgi:hypothetical protein
MLIFNCFYKKHVFYFKLYSIIHYLVIYWIKNTKLKEAVQNIFNKTSHFCTISNGWSNINKSLIINYIIIIVVFKIQLAYPKSEIMKL